MSKNKEHLSANIALCNTCNKSLPLTGDYITCNNCESKYHYSPCATLSESTYSVMNTEKKAVWKCHNCRGERNRNKSPNNLYQEVIYKEQQNHQQQQPLSSKQQRDDENNDVTKDVNNTNKRFKDSINLNTVNSTLTELKSDLLSLKTSTSNELSTINAGINQLNNNMIASNNALREEMANAFLKLTESLSTLSTQVNDLKQENENKEIRIKKLENKVNSMEQQMLIKNVEIKNIRDNNIDAIQIIKTIAESVNVNIQESDISNTYKIKKNENIIIEFCSLSKKKELMAKIIKHRVKGDIFNKGEDLQTNNDIENTTNQNNNTIFVNDQLTAHNRRLLWQAKNKAKETGWKYVWTRDGTVFAKKNENSTLILIHNACDIELIA